VWPAAVNPISTRHGYTTSAPVYAPGTTTTGYQVKIHSGSAGIYAGTPSGSHRLVASLGAGESATLPAVGAGEVFSIQSGDAFTFTLTPGDPPPPVTPPCQDPMTCNPVEWTPALWRCNVPECTAIGDWVGGVVAWPSWSAYASNGRRGDDSRTVHDLDGNKLYPYMGPWADGCQVTAVTGEILVIEWERGTNDWRETLVRTGQTYTIDLVGRENGAMLETPNNTEPFTASFASCTPQPIPPE
jgi:hypothetical protein